MKKGRQLITLREKSQSKKKRKMRKGKLVEKEGKSQYIERLAIKSKVNRYFSFQIYTHTHLHARVHRSGLAKAKSLLISDMDGGLRLGVTAAPVSCGGFVAAAAAGGGGGGVTSVDPAPPCWPLHHSAEDINYITVGSLTETSYKLLLYKWS